jgi:hypothetical protein
MRGRTETQDIEVIMRNVAVFVAVATLALMSAARIAAAQGPASAQAHISGRVMSPGGGPVTNATVRARDLLSGQIGSPTPLSSAGQFALNVNPGSYMLEVIDGGGQILGTSSFISAAAGATITATTVVATTGALSVATTTAGLVSTLGQTAARSVTYAAAAAGVAGVVTPADVITASPSR